MKNKLRVGTRVRISGAEKAVEGKTGTVVVPLKDSVFSNWVGVYVDDYNWNYSIRGSVQGWWVLTAHLEELDDTPFKKSLNSYIERELT